MPNTNTLQTPIIWIGSSDPKKSSTFGTGFVVHRDATGIYLVTCAHVVDDIGKDQVRIGAQTGSVIALGERNGFDVAVVWIKDIQFLMDVPPLSLRANTGFTGKVELVGYSNYGGYKECKPLQGRIGSPSSISNVNGTAYVQAWDIEVDDQQILKRGYSGSPVIDSMSKTVVGIVITKDEEGKQGKVLSIEVLRHVWRDRPAGILPHEPAPAASVVSRQPGPLQQLRRQRWELLFTRPYEEINKLITLEKFDLAAQMGRIAGELAEKTYGVYVFAIGCDYHTTTQYILPRIREVVYNSTGQNLDPDQMETWFDVEGNNAPLTDQWLQEGYARSDGLNDGERVNCFLVIYHERLPVKTIGPVAKQIVESLKSKVKALVNPSRALIILLWINLDGGPLGEFFALPAVGPFPLDFTRAWLADQLQKGGVDEKDIAHCLAHLEQKIVASRGHPPAVYQTLSEIVNSLKEGKALWAR